MSFGLRPVAQAFVVPAPSQRTRRNGAPAEVVMSARSKAWATRQMVAVHSEGPAFVQNRCYARRGWDREVRLFCDERGITYQGFSLLTANKQVVRDPLVGELAAGANATPAQVVFAFARAVGMVALTGTSSAEHMTQDLASSGVELAADAVRAIEGMVG